MSKIKLHIHRCPLCGREFSCLRGDECKHEPKKVCYICEEQLRKEQDVELEAEMLHQEG